MGDFDRICAQTFLLKIRLFQLAQNQKITAKAQRKGHERSRKGSAKIIFPLRPPYPPYQRGAGGL
jgi:hypothetical protein